MAFFHLPIGHGEWRVDIRPPRPPDIVVEEITYGGRVRKVARKVR